ncbi:zinc metalloproteinase nas-4 isoform X2 [Toxorhynchites rutilus septentrionalis]|uniref:zinc metalloproteinase nas-4 isoform X2 n=1 Tax=Toxorhynchites rutilus septentrionalis TaxID=329112 RepID=UPI00247865B9|nr:zinc metalloproteinase nas-4 isoform X2 [Toxorhynchites rutilus septentrionalis]
MAMSHKMLLVLLAATWLTVANCNVILRDDAENEVDSNDGEIDLSHLGTAIYGAPDPSVGERVSQYNPETDLVNPEELGTYAGGDMLITRPAGRNGLADKSKLWSNGVVPFVIEGNFDAFGMQLIEDAMNKYHAETCIKFVPRTKQQDYISIQSTNSGCWSSVGRLGGKQEVNLQIPGCTTKVGTVAHELMHAVGFLHEQNRDDRDDFVLIKTENIQPGTESNFVKARSNSVNSHGVRYDYGSIMHYSANAFSVNGKPTIVPKKTFSGTMGQRDGFSKHDLQKINTMYNCK